MGINRLRSTLFGYASGGASRAAKGAMGGSVEGFVALYFLMGLVLAAICGNLWRSKGGSYVTGALIGAFFGVFGLAYVWWASPATGYRGTVPDYYLTRNPGIGDTVEVVPKDDVGSRRIGQLVRGIVVSLTPGEVTVKTPEGELHRAPLAEVWVIDLELDVKTCPRCAETVKVAAAVCRFCGHEFGPG